MTESIFHLFNFCVHKIPSINHHLTPIQLVQGEMNHLMNICSN